MLLFLQLSIEIWKIDLQKSCTIEPIENLKKETENHTPVVLRPDYYVYSLKLRTFLHFP
jgi:hypothetical protein